MQSGRSGVQSLREELKVHLAAEGLKRSRQRDAVIDVFLASTGHETVDDLVARLAAQGICVGQSTVYRTIKLLTRIGFAAAHHFGDGQTRYEGTRGNPHHDHLLCEACGGVEEFSDGELEKTQDDIARRHGFVLEGHVFELHGRCRRCRASDPRGRAS
jgi:Fur family ferric uptake transcriptional regulator